MSIRNFRIEPISQWVGTSAVIKRPKEIACFSYDDEHQLHLDDRSLRYYFSPRIGADLCRGFDTFQKQDDTADEHIDSLLKTIAAREQESGHKVDCEIITWRGMMTKIMAAPFSDRDGFEMNATLFQGTIFIEENHDFKLARQAQQSRQVSPQGGPSQDMMSYWGYKFETLCLIPTTWDATSRDYIEGREDQVVNNKAQYCSVVRTGIGQTTLILGGEVDAVWDVKPEPPDTLINWVELKTSADPRSEKDLVAFERKLMKFWIQSFLLGVPKIIVGFRDRNGILVRVEEMETAKIPGAVKKGRGIWDGNMCINFTAAFLQHLKSTITEDGVWRIRRRERSSITEIFKIVETGHGDILSDEFINWRIKLSLGGEGKGDGVHESQERGDGEAS